jgi:hygromycin-B 7''-O-kinase
MKLSAKSLNLLDTLDGYKQHFTDLILWQPYVREVCIQQGFSCPEVRPTLPGTYPTFFAGDKVIKFFGQLFDGEHSFNVEREAAHLLSTDPLIPVPALRAEGTLFGWYYLVYDYLPGESIGQSSVNHNDKLSVACWLAENVRRLHRLPLIGNSVFSNDPDIYQAFLDEQFRNITPNALPAWVVESLPGYVLSPHDLMRGQPAPHLIHSDLTRDHILGIVTSKGWQPNGIIDFGDAMAGDLYYELVVLHLDLFDCDKRLLKEFLDDYGFIPPADFPRRMMSMTLLHRFDVLAYVMGIRPELQRIRSLENLANKLWNISEFNILD